jgi:hypothetical protein
VQKCSECSTVKALASQSWIGGNCGSRLCDVFASEVVGVKVLSAADEAGLMPESTPHHCERKSTSSPRSKRLSLIELTFPVAER